MRRKMKLALVIAFATAGVFTSNGYAQVTIGSESAPHSGALLDLKQNNNTGANSTKGLLLPRVELMDYSMLTVAAESENTSAIGMIVWNTNPYALKGVGTYQWDGTQWVEILAAGLLCVAPTVSSVGNSNPDIKINQTTTLSVTATGVKPFTYQWYSGTVGDETTSVVGADAASYEVPTSATTAAGTLRYWCKVTNNCEGEQSGNSPQFTVTVTPDPSAIPLAVASGSLYGKTCFDIVASDGGADCGTTATRMSTKADFSGADAATRQYTYIFKPAAGCSNLSWVVEDWATKSLLDANVAVVAQNESGSLTAGNEYSCTITFRQGLNADDDLIGLTRNNAAKVVVYAIFTNGQGQVQLGLTLNIQDCACCGALVAADTWKEFMCHNLGADVSKDPFTPSRDINGSYFQWGSKTAARTQDEGDNSYWDSSSPRNTGYGSNGNNIVDDKVKSTTDPCPTGYRVPSYNEWIYLINNNTKTNKNADGSTWAIGATNFTGSMFGTALFLPAAGDREEDGGSLENRGAHGYYWSTRGDGSSGYYAQGMYFFDSGSAVGQEYRTYGYTVRCISEN